MATKVLDPKVFDDILATGEAHRLKEFFAGTTAEERLPFAKKALAAFRKLNKPSTEFSPQFRSALNATLVTASADDIATMRLRVFIDTMFDFFLLNELRPNAIRKLGDVMLKQDIVNYRQVRIFVEKGLCDVPTCDEYVLAMINDMSRMDTIVERFDSDPNLRAVIPRFFEIEGSGENSLAAHDKFSGPGRVWSTAFCKLASDGKLSRDWLLDQSLHALNRGFEQFRAGWFSRFHEELKPTLEERRDRLELYGPLLASSIGPTVSFALSAIKAVDAEYPLSADFLAEYLGPVLTVKSKGTVSGALAMIAKTAKRDPAFVPRAAVMAVDALTHESPDVQSKALELVGLDGAACGMLVDYVDLIAPSLKARALSLLGDKSAVPPATHPDGARYVQTGSRADAPVLAKLEPFGQISTIRQLVELMSRCLEGMPLAEVECVLDGASRLVAPNRKEFVKLADPVVVRAKRKALADGLRADAWYFGNFCEQLFLGAPTIDCEARGAIGAVFRDRFNSVLSTVAAGHSLPAFAFPTHDAFWIDPEEFRRRDEERARLGIETPFHEREVALCRLPPWAVLPEPVSMTFTREDIYRADPTDLLWKSAMYPRLRREFIAASTEILADVMEVVYMESRLNAATYALTLTDWSQPCTDAMWELLSICLFSVDAQVTSYAVDAMVMLITQGDLDVEQLGEALGTKIFGAGRPPRLVKSLSDVARVSAIHADAVLRSLERAMQGGEKAPKSMSPLLELLHELLVSQNARLTNERTLTYLRSVKTAGKAKKLVDAILSR